MSGERKAPSYQWYPGDHRRDTAVMACSLHARGLWREMLDLMFDGQPRGHLTAGGVAITVEQLARLVGEDVAKTRKLLGELEARQVFSRTDAGVIFSRRMVRDAHLSEVRRSAGKLGGNPNLLKQTGNQVDNQTPKQRDNQKPTPAVASAVAAEDQKQHAPASADAGSPDFLSRTAPLPAARTWLTPFLDAWRARYDGDMSIEPSVRPLRTLVEQWGAEETARRWAIYLAATDGAYANAARFASTFGEWNKARIAGKPSRFDAPVQTRAEVLWRRYLDAGLLRSLPKQEYERIGAELVAAGHYESVPAFLDELRITKPWTLGDAKTDAWGADRIAERLTQQRNVESKAEVAA